MNAYWGQYTHEEIMSMHGVELEDCDDELEVTDEEESYFSKKKNECCSGCMSCLGLSVGNFY